MRLWDLDPRRLCRPHLAGEHRELHAIWTVLTEGRTGHSRHPETLRREGRLPALYRRHDLLVSEMSRRGCDHRSPPDPGLARGRAVRDTVVDPPARQIRLLRAKGCDCSV